MNILIEIPARGGSKGVPRKALQMIGDVPLIAYTIRDALLVKKNTKVIVNTDDHEIRDVAIRYGAEVPFLRPSQLADDNSSLQDALDYSRKWLQQHERFIPDVYIIMSPTHPFRRKDLIDNALKQAMDNPLIFNLGSVSPANATIDNYWIKTNGTLKKFNFSGTGETEPETLYQSAFSFNIVFNCRNNLPDRRVPIVLNEIEAVDIDEPRDLEIARMVIKEGLYPFE